MTTATKIDLYKKHRAEYAAPRRPTLLNIAPAKYLTIKGKGRPGGEVFQAKIGAMYAVAFTIKMTSKFAGRDYTVCKLEGQWWASGRKRDFFDQPKDQWNWKLLIRTPDFITQTQLDSAIETLIGKGKPAEVGQVKLERLEEGRCVQVLHVGPYDDEPATIAIMKAFAEQQDLSFHGLHHEIYLCDPRRVPPQRLRTILRQPVR